CPSHHQERRPCVVMYEVVAQRPDPLIDEVPQRRKIKDQESGEQQPPRLPQRDHNYEGADGDQQILCSLPSGRLSMLLCLGHVISLPRCPDSLLTRPTAVGQKRFHTGQDATGPPPEFRAEVLLRDET